MQSLVAKYEVELTVPPWGGELEEVAISLHFFWISMMDEYGTTKQDDLNTEIQKTQDVKIWNQ